MTQVNFDDLGVVLHALHGALGEDLALMQHGHLVGDVLDELHVVLDHQHRAVLDDTVDFVKVSEGLGAKGYRVSSIEEFKAALKEAIELNIPCVIDCLIDREDKVFPMVSPGAAISEAFDRQDLENKNKNN